MKQFIFIRHAATDMAGTLCGHSDPELNELGRGQLAGLTNGLSGYPSERIYTSDLRRAQQTAEAIAHHFRAEICLRRGLREIDFGLWDGLSWREIELRYPAIARNWIEYYPHLTAPQGETFKAFQQRVLAEITSLIAESLGPNVVVVTHAGFIRVVLTLLCGWPEPDVLKRTQGYAAVVTISENEMRKR
jgi:broad specificity phosphatase PhoE